MKIDAQLGSLYPGKAAEMAKRMQAMGFDAVWSFEAGHDPFLPLMAAAMSTDKIQIGTNIAVAFGRSPFATAQADQPMPATSPIRLKAEGAPSTAY